MVLDPIPQSLPVHFFGSRPQPPTSRFGTYCHICYQYIYDICCIYYLLCIISIIVDPTKQIKKLSVGGDSDVTEVRV